MDQRIAIITGAARGLGRAVAKAYTGAGMAAMLVDVLESDLAATAKQFAAEGKKVITSVTDITDPDQVEAMVERTEKELGPVEVLVNCAGTFSYIGPVWEADPETWFRDTRINLYGSFLCCRSVLQRMTERKKGYVVNFVSMGGVGDPHAFCTSYAVSKAALMRLTEGLAEEVKDLGIKVFALAPPAVKTAMTEFIMQDAGGRKWRPQFKDLFKEHQDEPPENIAQLCLDLVSGRADALSGRFFNARLGITDFEKEQDRILEEDLLTLRIRHLDS